MTTPYWKLITEYGVKAGERIADLERDLENAKLPRGQFVPGRVTDIINPAEPYILRKQAEAVSDFGQPFDRMHRMVDSRAVHEDVEDYAQRLRQQADELERKQ